MSRALSLGALALAMCAAPAPGQQMQDTAAASTPSMDARLRTEIRFLSLLPGTKRIPPADSFSVGRQEIAAGTTRAGPVAVARGNLEVRGRIDGDAVVLHGEIVVHPGGVITGNALAVDGRVRTAGGVIEGDIRSIRGITGGILARAAGRGEPTQPLTTWSAVKLVLGWFAVLFVIGVGVLLFAEKNLDGVVTALEQQFGRSFWNGVLAQLAAIPALLLLLVALAITVIGILLVPFATVAYIIALAGLVTLGFLAVARFTGRVFFRDAPPSRAVSLRSLFLGLVLYVGLWLLAAAFTWNPVVGSVLRAVALAGTWVAVTFGLGATLVSRAGTRRQIATQRTPQPADDLSWQTPTPVTGVVAARRPAAAARDPR